MSHDHIIRRLRYLRNGELFNIFFQPAILLTMIALFAPPTRILYAATMGMVCFILLQGSLYWHLKLRVVRGRAPGLPESFGTTFTRFKRINQVLLVAYVPIAVIGALCAWSRGWEVVWATLIWLFALAEYINYYHIQLMYDSANDLRYLARHRRLRRSHLAMDLAERTETR